MLHAIVRILLFGLLGVGLFLLIQFVLHLIFRNALRVRDNSAAPLSPRDRIFQRYGDHPMYVFMFAYFKTRLDPMFDELPDLLRPAGDVRTLLDLGCGFGFAGSFLLDHFPQAKLYGIDPSAYRVREAGKAWGPRGHAVQAAAPEFDLPELPTAVDCVLVLDVIHFLPDAAFDLTLRRIRARLQVGQRVIIRASVPPAGRGSWKWRIYQVYSAIAGTVAQFRTEAEVRAMLTAAGFDVPLICQSGQPRTELTWFVGVAAEASAAAQE